jgi:hypothetical protein
VNEFPHRTARLQFPALAKVGKGPRGLLTFVTERMRRGDDAGRCRKKQHTELTIG